jgi:hypothetical protein
MTEKIKHFIGRVPYATHTTHRIPAPRFDQTSGPGNTDLNPTDDERRILNAAGAAAVDLKRTFDNWVTMGRGLQLLRKKADLLGTRNAFNDLRDQNGLGDRFFNKTQVSKLLRVMDELEAVDKWRATLTEKQRFEWASPDAIIRHCPVFNPPPGADAMRKPSAYAKLERTNDDLARELDAAKAHIAELVFNSGHRRGGGIDRFVGGCVRKFWVFAPLAVAAIGMLPLPLLHRALVVNMQRSGGSALKRLDESDPAFAIAREGIQRWAARCILAQDPEMPAALRDRAADNWRVLLAIADNLGYGEPARLAAVALSANRPDEDPGVRALVDTRTVLKARGVDRIASSALVEALTGLDDGRWNEWRGPKDDRPPRKLTQGELSHLLRPFGIVPKTIWPGRRRPGDKSSRGYLRSQFENVWRAYCPSPDTPTQSSKIIRLPPT